MLIIGAPDLDQPPLGLGHKPTVGGHYFSGPDMILPRVEADEVQRGIQGQLVASFGPLRPLTQDPRIHCVASSTGLPLYLLDAGNDIADSDGPCGGGILAVAPQPAAAPVVLIADDITLRIGEAALVPAQALFSEPCTCCYLSTNVASTVAAFAGEWDGPSGLLCIGNFSQPEVVLGKGDLVASAVRVDASAAAPLAHVWRDEDEVQIIQEVDMPPAEYYQILSEWRRKKHPKADPFLLDHLDVLEPFLDLCIISGFSLGAAKSCDKIAQHRIQFLGEIVGRDGREATDHHLKTVREFKLVEDLSLIHI